MNKLLLLLFALSLLYDLRKAIYDEQKEMPILIPINNEFITLEEFKAAKRIWEVNHPGQKIDISVIFSIANKAKEEKK